MMLPRFPANLVKNVKLPEGARIVVFTGHPRPHEALSGEWPAPWYKKPYKSLRPVTWLARTLAIATLLGIRRPNARRTTFANVKVE